jgi:hypothetical protein
MFAVPHASIPTQITNAQSAQLDTTQYIVQSSDVLLPRLCVDLHGRSLSARTATRCNPKLHSLLSASHVYTMARGQSSVQDVVPSECTRLTLRTANIQAHLPNCGFLSLCHVGARRTRNIFVKFVNCVGTLWFRIPPILIFHSIRSSST